MKKKAQFKIIELFTLILIVIIGSYFVYGVATNAIYSIGADAIFKSNDNCKMYKDLYIAEMKKDKNGNTSPIIQQAKNNSCKK